MHHKPYYPHIDGLRAIAVSAVFLCHLDFAYFSGGFVGVDVFFVISGFLITNIIYKQLNNPEGFSFISFYTQRIRRILPALFVTLVLAFISSVGLLNPAAFKIFGTSLAYAALSFSNLFFNNQAGYFDVFSQSSPLLHTWSLGVEEQFYLFFPLILFLWHRFFKINAITVIIILFTLSFMLNLSDQNSKPVAIYYLAQYRIFEFCIGAFIVFFMNRQLCSHFLLNEALCLLGFVLIIGTTLTYNSYTLFPTYNALIPCLGAALVIYTGQTKYCGYFLRCRPVRSLGLISYSLYLIHWPLIIFCKTYHQDRGLKFNLEFNEKLAIIAVALIAAFFMYSFVEQPFRKKKKPLWDKNIALQSIVQGSSLALMIACCGTLIGNSHGWLWRTKNPMELKQIKDVTKYHVDHWGGAGFSGEFIHRGSEPQAQIVVMGDSHAGMLDEGMVRDIAAPLGLTVFTASGGGAGKYASSLLIPGITRLDKNQKMYDQSAKSAFKEALNVLKASDQSILIISASWAKQLDAAGFIKNHQPLNINASLMSTYADYKPLTSALDNLVSRLGDRKLILIGDVPGSRFNPINCLGRLKWFKRSDCTSTDDAHLNKGALNVNRILALYASQKSNVYFLNPYTVFCHHGYCQSGDQQGHPYYSDGSHLSKLGSRFLMSHFKDDILLALNSTQSKITDKAMD